MIDYPSLSFHINIAFADIGGKKYTSQIKKKNSVVVEPCNMSTKKNVYIHNALRNKHTLVR